MSEPNVNAIPSARAAGRSRMQKLIEGSNRGEGCV